MATTKDTETTFTSFPQYGDPSTTLAISPDTSIEGLEQELTTISDSHIYICTFRDCQVMHEIFHRTNSSQDLQSSITSNTKCILTERGIGAFVAAPKHFYSKATCEKADKARGMVVIASFLTIKTSKDEAIRRFQSLGNNKSKICNYLKNAEHCQCGVINTPISEREYGDGLTIAQIKALFATQNTLEIQPDCTFECITKQLESVDTSLIYRCTKANFETVHQGFHDAYFRKKTEKDNSAAIKPVDKNITPQPIGAFIKASFPKRFWTADSEKDEQAYAVSVIINLMIASNVSMNEIIDRFQSSGIKNLKYLQHIESTNFCECGMIKVPFDRNDISEALTVKQIHSLMHAKEEFTIIDSPHKIDDL